MTHPRRAALIGPAVGGLLAALLLAALLLAALLLAGPGPATASSAPTAAVRHGATLLGVSCTRSARCMTVGSRARTSTTTDTLSEELTGGRWRVLPTPNPAGARSSFLNEVSCRSAARCVGVGASTSKAHGTVALAQAWNGRRWRLTHPVSPAGALFSELLDVSCQTSSGCMAVGLYSNASGRLRPLAEFWDGARWRLLTTPDARRAQAGILDGLFCAGTHCKAVGFFRTSPSHVAGLAEAWNGVRWRVVPFPDPARARYVDVQDVSCASSARCVAVGFAFTFGPTPRSVAELWRAGRWHLVKAAARTPSGAMLNGVSCPATSRCVSVGEALTTAGRKLLAEAWNGAGWRVLRTPRPPAAIPSFLNQVSCAGARRCVAVGSSGDGVSALAESWNGISWRVLTAPSP
jgi:hypothetical protein